MAQLVNLQDLLKHEILDLYSAEEQIIEALPKMIENAENAELKNALSKHLKVTKDQKGRLDKIKALMGSETEEESGGFFSKLFGSSEKCKGTEGLITEGEKMMAMDMTPQTKDAAIISAAQKIEHYEICGYGTSVAYAKELGMTEVAQLLEQTLTEEYEADDSLTKLAVGKLNIKSENASADPKKNQKLLGKSKKAPVKSISSKSGSAKTKTSPVKKASNTSSSPKKATGKKTPVKKISKSKR